jgi:Tfp pilus assembly PilM family ATPase
MFSLFEKSRRSAAFSFDNGFVRYVLVEKTGKGIQVVDYGSDFFGFDILNKEDVISDDAAFVNRLRLLLQKIDFRTALPEVNIVIPDGQAIMFHTHVTKEPAREMADIIIDHIKTYCTTHELLEFPEYICEYDIFHETSFGYDVHVTLVPKKYTQHLARLFKQAGITVQHVETAHHSVTTECITTGLGTGTVLVSFGRYHTTVALLHHNHLVSQERLLLGEENVRQVIKRFLNVSDDYVQKIIEKHGIMQTHPDNGLLGEIYLELAPLYRSIQRQIIQVGELPYKTIAQRFTTRDIVLYGEGVSLKGLAGFLAEKTHLHVDILDVWAKRHHERAPIIEMPLDQTYHYAEPLSLALMYLSK